MNLPIKNKKQERLTLIIMALVLVLVLLVSKFVLGINFSLMEHGSYVAFGYHEIRGDEIWAMSFDSFSRFTPLEINFHPPSQSSSHPIP